MAIDTLINRISTDSNTSVPRKRPNSESIDVSKLSFFEELLSIGQFESSIPDATVLPIEQRSSPGIGSESKSSSAQIEDSAKTEAGGSRDPTAAQSAYAAQVSAQQQLTPQPQVQSPEKEVIDRNVDVAKSTDKNEDIHQVDNSVAAKISKDEDSNTQRGIAKTRAPDGAEKSLPAEGDSNVIRVEQQPEEDDGNSLTDGSIDTDKSKPKKAIKASANASDANADHNQSGQDNIELSHVRSDSKPKRSTDISEAANQNANDENIDVSPTQTRNKRSERLAKQATESGPVSNKRDTSSETKQPLAPSLEAAKTETPSDQHSLSFASEQNSSSPITSIPPVIAPSTAFNTSVPNTTTSQNSRPNSEGISAIATSSLRGGIQTNTSTTTFAGSTSNPIRAEQGRAEAARSNAGPHISAYQETKLVQRVLRGVEQLANGGGQVRLRLHPPELGSLQMSLRMEDGQVFAKLEVENSTARDALLNNVQTLRDRLTEQGMRVAAFEVEVSTDSAGSGTGGSNFQGDGGTQSQSRWNNATSRFAQQNDNRLSSEPQPPERRPGTAWTRTNGSIDLTV